MLRYLFPVSGVETYLWLPPLVALVVSFFTSMAGVSGAFILLPFQMSVLGFTSPSVSSTNLVFNIVAIPSGVARFIREQRMLWPMTWVIVVGTVPGVIAGAFIRLSWLPDPKPFKAFVGCVLLYIGARLAVDLTQTWRDRPGPAASPSQPLTADGLQSVEVLRRTWRVLTYRYQGRDYSCSIPGVLMLALVVGVVGGVYGIGGGAIIAPFIVAIYKLPVHTVAGATLTGTLVTSVVGVLFYQLIAPQHDGISVAPDWLLGGLFGIGGLAGMYLGARAQRFVPARWLKVGLAVLLLYLSVSYLRPWLAAALA